MGDAIATTRPDTTRTASPRNAREFAIAKDRIERSLASGSISFSSRAQQSAEQSLRASLAGFFVRELCTDKKTPDGITVLDFSAGDLTNYFPGRRLDALIGAVHGTIDRENSYLNPTLYTAAREAGGQFFGVPPTAVFPTNGISGAMPWLLNAMFSGRRTGEKIVVISPGYPTWRAEGINRKGLDSIVEIPRTADGQPDLRRASELINQKTALVVLVTHDNPVGICIREDILRNKEGTGILDLVDKVLVDTGKIILVAFDIIYMPLSWSSNSLSLEALKELTTGRNAVAYLHSLSKAHLLPGVRAGMLAIDAPSSAIASVSNLIRAVRVQELNALGINNGSLGALIKAFGNSPDLEAELSEVKEDVHQRVASNSSTISEIEGVNLTFPGITEVECAFYSLFSLKEGGEKWRTPAYKRAVWNKLLGYVERMTNAEKREQLLAQLENIEKRKPPEEMHPAEIFTLDLVMTTGVYVIPGHRFKLMKRNGNGALADEVFFRAVLAERPDITREAADRIKGFIRPN